MDDDEYIPFCSYCGGDWFKGVFIEGELFARCEDCGQLEDVA